jgi:hypothetical protein
VVAEQHSDDAAHGYGVEVLPTKLVDDQDDAGLRGLPG